MTILTDATKRDATACNSRNNTVDHNSAYDLGGFASAAYGAVVYVFFLGTFSYAMAFVGNLPVPKTIDSAAVSHAVPAAANNLLLLAMFAVQHSVMARAGFKRWWTRIVPPAVERSTYVLFASALLALLCWRWQPILGVVWSVANPLGVFVLRGLYALGVCIALLSTFLINHFELFGLRQVLARLRGRTLPAPVFRTPFLYRRVRHPLYLGLLLAFWATPVMTAGHLLFAAGTTAYILIAIVFEERDLVAAFGAQYRRYRAQVPMLVPLLRRANSTGES
jgi:protein-S-isoprenylcysteine O-methyltransferase Ste14